MRVERKVPLAPYTSMRIGGLASFMYFPENYKDVSMAIEEAKCRGLPLFVLGRGSNTIFGNYKGVVVNMRKLKGLEVSCREGSCHVSAECGVLLSELIKISLELNLDGIYKLGGFPATVGGAVSMNAGAFGYEICRNLKRVLFVNWEGEIQELEKEDLNFSYRSSPFPEKGIVLRAEFEFTLNPLNVMEEYTYIKRKRKRTQPINMFTCGSMFKNPKGDYAGRLLEKVNMKGYRVGDVIFSDVHANFLVNLGDGKFADVLKLTCEAKRRVYEEFGINLEEEVRLVESCSPYGG
ncbi:MAG: UDP-N-acetylmuramate dehydrogenase [Aquificaceae bacterium]